MKVVINGHVGYVCALLAVTVLEVSETCTIRRMTDLADPCGYCASSCYGAVRVLKFAEMITAKGTYQLTERGKIMLALLRGKQIHKRKRAEAARSGMGPRAAEFTPPGH